MSKQGSKNEGKSDTASTSTSPAASAEAQRLEAAFTAGNFSLARQLATAATADDAKSAATRIRGLIDIDRGSLMVGVLGLVVVLTAAAITLTRG